MFYLASFFCGALFGLGLAIARMVNPAKVLNFFDITGQWDPSLGLVFLAAVTVATIGYQWILRQRPRPVVATEFELPESSAVTPSLIGGSAIFGLGWGLAGFCPGPGIAALISLSAHVLVWVLMLFAGAACYRFVFAR